MDGETTIAVVCPGAWNSQKTGTGGSKTTTGACARAFFVSILDEQIVTAWQQRRRDDVRCVEYMGNCETKQTRNAWQSLAYSPLGVVLLLPSEYLSNTHPITDQLSA